MTGADTTGGAVDPAPEVDENRLRERIDAVRARMAAAAQRAGRDPGGIRLCAVTKTLPPAVVDAAWRLGLGLFGENRVQEARDKISRCAPGAEWHLIGHLQTNKIRHATDLFSMIESVDSIRVARGIDRRVAEQGRDPMPFLVEVNCSGEETKYGVAPEALPALLEDVVELPGMRLRGLMTIGPLSPDPEAARVSFAQLRSLRDAAARALGIELPELSMGMTGDFETAIEEGSTLVRVGTGVFGPRRTQG